MMTKNMRGNLRVVEDDGDGGDVGSGELLIDE